MIRINLLPHRELARQARRRQFGVLCAIVAAIGGAIIIAVGGVIQTQISSQKESNAFIQKENDKLDSDIKEIAKLREEIEGLKARQRAVEELQGNRNLPVHVLDELVKNTPDGIYLKSIKQTGTKVSLIGVAANQAKVADYVRNLGNNSEWLTAPELVEIKATTVGARRLNDFTMNISIKRPKPPEPEPAAKPAAPVAPKKA